MLNDSMFLTSDEVTTIGMKGILFLATFLLAFALVSTAFYYLLGVKGKTVLLAAIYFATIYMLTIQLSDAHNYLRGKAILPENAMPI